MPSLSYKHNNDVQKKNTYIDIQFYAKCIEPRLKTSSSLKHEKRKCVMHIIAVTNCTIAIFYFRDKKLFIVDSAHWTTQFDTRNQILCLIKQTVYTADHSKAHTMHIPVV